MWRKPLIFQTMISSKSNNLSLKYKRLPPKGCKEIGIRKIKAQFF